MYRHTHSYKNLYTSIQIGFFIYFLVNYKWYNATGTQDCTDRVFKVSATTGLLKKIKKSFDDVYIDGTYLYII